MKDDPLLSLVRSIHGTPHATRDSFSASQWAGVERAWAWVEKHYQPKEPTVKQEPTIYGAPIIEDKYLPPGHGLVGVNVSAFETPTPPWTDAQREAVYTIWSFAQQVGYDREHGGAYLFDAISRTAPLFVKVPSVEECERAYHRAWRASAYPHMQNAMVTRNESAGIAAVRALMMQGDGGGAAQRVVEPHSSTDGGGSARSEASASSGVVSTEATVASKGLPPSPAPAGVPTLVSCPCSKCGHGRHEHDRYGSCLASGSGHGGFCACGRYEDKDGASVPGDSGLKSGHNMERGSGCPASDDHADRETSTPHAPKEQAPSTICGVAPWPDRMDIARLVRKTRFDYVNERDWHGEPASVDFMHADAALTMFAPALRTRDERIAELERRLAERCDQVDALQHERDKVMARLGNACQPYEIEDRIRGLQMRAGERDVLRQHLDASRALVKEHAATIATLTKERDEASAKIDKMHPRLDGLADFYKCAREVCDGFNTDKPLAEALRLLRSGYDNVCEDAKTLRARVAELERIIRDVRQATPTSDDSNWNGDPQGLANEVGNRFRELQDRVAELEKRGAVTGEQLHAAALPTWGYLTTWDKTGNKASWNEIAERLNLQSRDVRRITREDVYRAANAHCEAFENTYKSMAAALRAIGFEVEA